VDLWKRVPAPVRGIVGSGWKGVASLIPGAGPAVGPAAEIADYWRNRDIAEEAFAQIVMASRDLCAAPISVSPPTDLDAHFHPGPAPLPMPQLIDDLMESSDSTRRNPREWIDIAAAAQKWQTIPASLDEVRGTFVRELAGLFLVPRAAARAANRQRAKLLEAVVAASRAQTAIRRRNYLQTTGGTKRQRDREDEAFLAARLATAYALRDVLDANEQLVKVAWSEIPKQMAELFPPPRNPGELEREARARRTQALGDLVENVREIPAIAADLGNVLDESNRGTRAATLSLFALRDFDFNDSHRANGWLSVANNLERARSVFEGATSLDLDDLQPRELELRTAIIRALNRGSNAAHRTSSPYQRRDDELRSRKPVSVDPAPDARRARDDFDTEVGHVLESIGALEKLLVGAKA